MKFLVTKELEHNRLLTLQVLLLTGVLTLFLLSDILLHHFQLGLTPALLMESVLGNEEAFIEPMVFSALLERIHMDLFISMITLMLLAVTYIRIGNSREDKIIHWAFISAILTPVSLLLGYFYGAFFLYLWLVLFGLWHLFAFYFSVYIFRKLL